MTYFLNIRAQSVGGDPVADSRDIKIIDVTNGTTKNVSPDELITNIRGKDVLLTTHGFNVSQQDGINSLALWQLRLTQPNNSVFIGILWPGDSAWLPCIDYPIEGNSATRSGRFLATFLNELFMESTSISFVSHSLGARMVLETIRQLNPARRVSNLILMAGAIDDDCLTNEYQDAACKVDKISVLASHGDCVLEFAFPTGNFLSGIISRGHPYWRAALGREGPESITNIHLHSGGWQIPNDWSYGHGDYLSKTIGTPMSPPEDLPTLLPSIPADPSAWSASFVSTRLK